MPMPKGLSALIKWIKTNGHRQPRELKATHGADKHEHKAARTLRSCRELDKQRKLPEEAATMLDEVRVNLRHIGLTVGYPGGYLRNSYLCSCFQQRY